MPRACFPLSRLFLLGGLVVAVVLYAVLLHVLELQHRSAEFDFGVTAETTRRVDIELDLFDIDPVRAEAKLQVTVRPGADMQGTRVSAARTDIFVTLQTGDVVQDLVFQANRRMATTELRIALEHGSVLNYPLDHYTTSMHWRAFEGTPEQRGAPIPIRFRTYESADGFDMHMAEAKADAAGEATLALDARRSVIIRWFAVALYASMAGIGVSSLAVGGLMFARIRRVEPPLLGALCAMVFALPAMRNTMPGLPPLGVGADLLVFLWSEVAVVIGLVLGVTSWVVSGARADVT